MGTTADKLNKLLETKQAIKQAIIDKGVDVSDNTVFADYPSKINSIESGEGGGDPYYEDLYNMRTNNGTNMAGLFSYYTASELDLRSLDVSKVTNMYNMFQNCSSSVNIDGWDTSKVTNMEYMFQYFSGSIDISKLDTSSITNVNYMFNAANTDNIILTGLSFPSATKLEYMFNSAEGTTLDLSSWDISNITSMYYMFNNAKYKRIDLTGWKTTNVTDMSNMFYNYSNPLEELIIPDWDMTNVTSSNSFYYVGSSSYKNTLKLIDLSRSNDTTITKIASFLPTRTTTTFGTVIVPSNTSQATYDTLIAKYWRPIGADLTPIPTSIEIASELDELIPGKPRTTRVYLNNCDPWYADPSKVEIVMVSDESIATIDGDTITSTGVLGDIVLEVRIIDTQEVIGTKIIPVTETDSYPNITKFRLSTTPSSTNTVITVNGSKKTLSNLTYDSIFDIYSYDAGSPITSINFTDYLGELVKLNISNITSMKEMYYSCKLLTNLDLSNWDTSNVTSMNQMFMYCNSLTTLDVSDFNTSNVTDMNTMFGYCFNLTSLDLSNFDTSNVTDMGFMFFKCNNLTSLDLSNFDTSKVTSIVQMFFECNSLHTLRLDNCNTDTIRKIITSSGFPTNAIEGQVRTIYCKEENAAGLTPPTEWVFSFIEE